MRTQGLDGGGAAGDAKMKRYLIEIFEKKQQSNANASSIESPSDQLTEHASSVQEHNQESLKKTGQVQQSSLSDIAQHFASAARQGANMGMATRNLNN